MSRLHFVAKAMKKNEVCEKGQSYYWWATRTTIGKTYHKSIHKSKDKPKPSRLESSPFTSGWMSALEAFDDLGTGDDFESAVADVVGNLEDLMSETQDKYDNLPEGLQAGQTGEMLQGRVDSLQELIDELGNVSVDMSDVSSEEPDEDDVKAEAGDKEEDETKEEYEERLADAERKLREEREQEAREEKAQEIIDELQGISYNGE